MVGDDSLFYKEGNKWKQKRKKKRGFRGEPPLLVFFRKKCLSLIRDRKKVPREWCFYGMPRGAGANARAHLADEWVEVAIAKFKIGKKDKTESKAEVGKALPSRGKYGGAIFGGWMV